MRRAPIVAAVYAALASALSVGVEVGGGEALVVPLPLLPLKLAFIIILVLTTTSLLLLREGFRELFRRCRLLGRRSWIQDFILLAIYILIFALVFKMVYSLRGPGQLLQVNQSTGLRPVVRGDGGGTGGASPSTTPPNEGVRVVSLPVPGAEKLPVEPLIALLIGVFLITILYAARSSGEGVREESREVLKLIQAAEQAARELEEGGDPRRAIIGYFLRLCSLLQRRGLDVRGSLTAREVAQLAERILGMNSSNALRRLVSLFEEARYSSHTVDEDMRREALACFIELKSNLSRLGVASEVG
ncbi:MAG: hypothetical protein DRJ57_02690 [Thermoprotei archaeon]|nr:MAG: hypothetical protein DRJ57_02690 [Thermoprotei archaeon]